MKLIDILVRELPGNLGWPDGGASASQDRSGEIYFSKNSSQKYDGDKGQWIGNCWLEDSEIHLSNADDFAKAIITSAEYEAALAESKVPVWDGEGLPPVGCECEVSSEDFDDWTVIKVAFTHNGEIIGIIRSDNEYLNDRMEKFSDGYNGARFRPIRTEAERKREDAGLAIYHAINWNAEGELASPLRMEDYRKAYDAIAAGKIPGIRLTDDAGSQ